MCKEYSVSGKPCTLAKNKTICHIHERVKARKLLKHSKDEIKNLNKTISKKNETVKYLTISLEKATESLSMKNEKIKEQQELMLEANSLLIKVNDELKDSENERSELEREVAIMLAEREESKEEIQNLKDEIESMKEDFNNYQIIRRFEAIKFELRKHVDISDLDTFFYFCKQSKNRKILKSIMGDHDNYWNRFNELRMVRNKVSHWYY